MPTISKQDAGSSLDLVDIKEIRDSTVIVKDGSLRQIIMVGGVNFALKSDTEQNIITQAYQNFLNGVDFPLQIIIHSRKVNIDAYIQTLLERKAQEASPILQNQIAEYVEFIKGFVQKNAVMEKTFLVVLSYYPVGGGLAGVKSAASSGGGGIFSFFGGKSKPKAAAGKPTTKDAAATLKAEDAEKDFKEYLEQLNQRTAQVTGGLLAIGLEAETLNDEQLVELFYNFYNPQTIERKNIISRDAQQ
jgi:type IV secretory pathway VirB4 component